MKPTQLTELFANIRKTFVSFFSILMFVALGVGIFLGISWAGPALENAADRMFDEGAFHDVQVQFVYGLADDDLGKLGEVEGVSDVEAGYQSFQGLELAGDDYTVKVLSLGERIDVPLVVEGELPAADDEVAFGAFAARKAGIHVGDTLTFAEAAGSASATPAVEGEGESASETEGLSYLADDTFTVTALVNSPEYLANSAGTYGSSTTPSGGVNLLAWVLPTAFKPSAFHDGYPVVNVRCDELRDAGTFTDGYGAASDGVEARVTELGKQLATDRYTDLKEQA